MVYRLNFESGRFEYISTAATLLFGADIETVRQGGMEWVGRHMMPGDYEAVLARIAETAASRPGERVSLAVNYRVVDAGGRVRHCHDSMVIEADAAGRPRVALGVSIDVSRRIAAEVAMREKEAQFRATMEAAQVGIFVLQDGVFRYVNPDRKSVV